MRKYPATLALLGALTLVGATAATAVASGASAPCNSSANCAGHFALSSGKQLPYFSTYSLDSVNTVHHAVLVVHGTGRNANGYFDRMVKAATDAGVLADTEIVAPHFQTQDDQPADNEPYWTNGADTSWKDGGNAVSSDGESSFAVVDELIARLSDKAKFPDLDDITVTGHSAGGQFTQRYAVGGKVPAQHPELAFHYAPMNPSSYLYFTPDRPSGQGLPGSCPGFDKYKYGMDSRNDYLGGDAKQLIDQYTHRKVTYVLGGDDHYDNHGMDDSCSGMAQGPNRLARGQSYFSYIQKNYPDAPHDEVIVPGVGHDGGAMFDSEAGRKVLFGGTSSTPTNSASASSTAPPSDNPPTADELLAKAQGCENKLTKEPLQKKEDAPRDVDVCGKKGAVYLKADMDVDCDGQVTDRCNDHNGDCCFQGDTTFHQSDGKPLSAGYLPYVVLPRASDNWDWHQQGIDGGSVVAVIYQGKVTYAVFGDTDSPNKAGEASYATAESLGINPSPADGGVDDGVTYIVFPDKANPIENHDSAVSVGERAARQFVNNN